MKARVNQFEKGKKKVIKEFKSVKDAEKYILNQHSNYTVRTKVQRGLGWSIDKKTTSGWRSTSKFYN